MFFSKRPDGKIILILSVKSSIVRATLVLMREGEVSRVIFTHRVFIPYKARATSGYLVKSALHGAEECVRESQRFIRAEKKARSLPHLSAVHYVLSSPWVVSQAKVISADFDADKAVTRAGVLSMIAKERSKLASDESVKVEIIEEKIFGVSLNGYSMPSWQNKKARNIQVSYVTSVAGESMVRRFREVCESAVSEHKIFFHSSLLLQHIGIQMVKPERMSYILIHVHAELTDVVIVDRHTCVFFGSYPTGIQTLIRKVGKSMKTDPETTDSLLSMYGSGGLDAAYKKKAEPIITEIFGGWSAELGKLFKNGAYAGALPTTAFVTAHPHRSAFVEALKSAYPQTVVETIEEGDISSHVVFDAMQEHPLLAALHAMAIHSLEEGREA